MITIKSFDFNITCPLTNGTCREFCLSLNLPDSIHGNDFIWGFIKAGKPINTFNNRHKPIRDFVSEGDTLFATLWMLGGNRNFKNNLLATHEERETMCSICLDEFASNAVYDTILDCNHKFHYRCLAKIREPLCPCCRKEIRQDVLYIVRKYCLEAPLEIINR